MNSDILIGVAGAIILHGAALFAALPVTTPHYEVIVAPSALEISLVTVPPPQNVEKIPEPPVQDPPPPEEVEEPEIMRDIPEPPPEPEEMVAEPIEDIEEIPEEDIQETNVKQGATFDVQPLTHRNQPPNYPRQARKEGWEGRVVLHVLVSTEGLVQSIGILQSSGYEVLDNAAMKSIRQWLFEPAQLFGKPVEKRIEIPVLFRLEK